MKSIVLFFKNKVNMGIIILGVICLVGFFADKNLYRYKYYGESAASYEFGDNEATIQNEFSVNFPFKLEFVDLNGLIKRMFGQHEMNGIVKLNNGYLTHVSECISDEDAVRNAEEVVKFANYCEQRDVKLVYVQTAYKIDKYNNMLPAGVADRHNDTTDVIVNTLIENGIDVIDLREEMHNDGFETYDMYYKTDHHWTTRGGFYGYSKIAKHIQEITGTYLDDNLLDLDNYNVDLYEDWHLGSRGQKTGKYFAGIDDYELIYPKFETNILNKDTNEVTSAYDALVRTEVFEERNNQSRYTYDWAYCKTGINSLQSLDAQTDLNVLLLSDSFQQAVKLPMLLTYKNFYIDGYNTLYTSMIDKYNPDVIIIMPFPLYFEGTEIFKFVEE